MTAAEAIERDERRELRDAWRRNGGSHRRPLHSFRTKAERRAARVTHRLEIQGALKAAAERPADWLTARLIHPDHTALQAALAAASHPGELVLPMRPVARVRGGGWSDYGVQVRKDTRAVCHFTQSPNFWPVAAYPVSATDADPEAVQPVDPALPYDPDEVGEFLLSEYAAHDIKTAQINKAADRYPITREMLP